MILVKTSRSHLQSLLIDDPSQSMDNVRIEELAKALSEITDLQILLATQDRTLTEHFRRYSSAPNIIQIP